MTILMGGYSNLIHFLFIYSDMDFKVARGDFRQGVHCPFLLYSGTLAFGGDIGKEVLLAKLLFIISQPAWWWWWFAFPLYFALCFLRNPSHFLCIFVCILLKTYSISFAFCYIFCLQSLANPLHFALYLLECLAFPFVFPL